MNLFNAIAVGFKEIWAHKFRSFLTMLGVILGVASLLSMFSLTAGMAHGVRDYITQLGGIESCDVQSERRVSRGGAVVRTAQGEVDATLETKIARAREVLDGAGAGR